MYIHIYILYTYTYKQRMCGRFPVSEDGTVETSYPGTGDISAWHANRGCYVEVGGA